MNYKRVKITIGLSEIPRRGSLKNTTVDIEGELIMAQITKNMIIGDILKINMGVVPILLNEGMHCIGCPASQGESLEEACMVHGIDADALTVKLNEFLANVENEENK